MLTKTIFTHAYAHIIYIQCVYNRALYTYIDVSTYHSLRAVVAQLKNCPFRVNTTVELKNMTSTSYITGTFISSKYNPLEDASVVVAR